MKTEFQIALQKLSWKKSPQNGFFARFGILCAVNEVSQKPWRRSFMILYYLFLTEWKSPCCRHENIRGIMQGKTL